MRKKGIILMLIATLMLCFAACGPIGRDQEKVDLNKTQLYVGNYNGGLGSEWLTALKKSFEEKYKDQSFETGKTGVQVWIDNKKEEYNGDKLLTAIQNNRQAIYFTSEVLYEDMVRQGKLVNITETVTEKYDEVDGEKLSIEDKMTPYLKEYFQQKGPNDATAQYYAIPFFTAVYGIVYDVDLFEEKNFFNLSNYSSQDGPDGKPDTEDDGLPATWADFIKLMNFMRSSGVVPFTWAGIGNEYYRLAFLRAVWASYEGYNDYMLNFSFDGIDSQIGAVTEENGYRLQEQMGKKAAIKAAKDMVSNKEYYSNAAFTTTQSHTQAQSEFLLSKFSTNMPPIGMILEGGWWENEARETFTDMVPMYGETAAYGTRRFGYMPFPKFTGTPDVDDQTYEGRTMYSDGRTMVFLNAAVSDKEQDLAKKFLQFTTSNYGLAACTRMTGVVRPYKYTLAADELAEMTPYGRSMWNYYNEEGTELTVAYSNSDVRYKHSSYFGSWDFYGKIKVGNGEKIFTDPLLDFSENREVTVEAYYKSLQEYHSQSVWQSMLNS